ncbi:MAG: hypothetical protein JO111_19030 [Caulobacteraceae bacterium]|nr:hypothetical protein [Caulobacteraceae bacterium]
MTKAEEYRARERDALASAEAATLDRVREQRQRAAAIWTGLAEAEEVRASNRLSATNQAGR